MNNHKKERRSEFIFISVIIILSGCTVSKPVAKDFFYNTDWHYNPSNYEKMQREADAMIRTP